MRGRFFLKFFPPPDDKTVAVFGGDKSFCRIQTIRNVGSTNGTDMEPMLPHGDFNLPPDIIAHGDNKNQVQ